VRRHELLLVWWIEGSLQGTAAVALYLVAAAGIGAVVGQPLAEVPWAAAVAAIVLLPGVFHPFLVDSPSYRSGSLRTILLFYGLIGLVGLAWALEGVAPLLGASTPVGGLGLALLGRTTAAGTLLAIATTALASAAGAWWTVRALQTMDVTGGGLGRTARRRAAGRYGPEVALLMLLALASTTTWVPLDFAANRPLWALLLGQVLFLAVPAVGVARYLGLDTRSVLQWRAPPWWSVALAPVIAAGTVALALAIVTATDPWFPDRSAGAFSDLLRSLMTPAGMLLVVLLPAICEELLFRGAMLGLLRRGMPIWLAIGLQAVLFGAVHLMAERLLPTAAVGIVLGILAWRTRSLLPGMLVHALHNAGALWLAHRGFD